MATMHTHPAVQTTIVEHGHRKPSLSHSTDADVLLPNLNTPTHTRRVSGSSFLSSDTEPSPTSSNGATLPPPISSFEISTANTLSLPMPPKPAPPLSNPLMYPGYEHGAPLSDIGEEDTPMSKRTRSRSPSFIESSPVASRSAPIWNQKSERRLSEMSSSSNFSAGSDQWEGFDARVGMSDRLKADLAAAGDDSFNLEGFGSKRNSTNEDEELTTQALSKRAEQILANAKKRLTVCLLIDGWVLV